MNFFTHTVIINHGKHRQHYSAVVQSSHQTGHNIGGEDGMVTCVGCCDVITCELSDRKGMCSKTMKLPRSTTSSVLGSAEQYGQT